MLAAILKGKAGRVSIDNENLQSWREIFRQREDLLTAVFFSRIRYLSEEGERKVMTLLIGEESVKTLGEIKELVFWSKLTVKNLESRSFVEPDVLIICENATILVEVKPPFGGMQYEKQWRNEIESLVQQKENSDEEWEVQDVIHFLSLGRNPPNWKQQAATLEIDYKADGLHFHALEWEAVNHGITQLFNQEEGRDRAVYSDWIEAFTLFGMIERPLSFADLLPLISKVSDSWQQLFIDDTLPIEEKINNSMGWLSVMPLINKKSLDINLWK